MALRFRNTDDAREHWLRLFLYGPTRSGKSVAAASFPDPVQVCPPNEDSWKSLRGKNIPYIVVGEDDPLSVMRDMNEFVDQLIAAHKQRTLHENFGKTVIVESLSHYSDAVVSQLTNGGKAAPNQQTWGGLRTHLLSIRDRLFQLPMHVIFTSLEKITTDDRGTVTAAGPRVTGSAGELLPSSCDLVGVTEQVASTPPKFLVHFRKYGHFDAGTRLQGMPPQTIVCGDGVQTQTLWQQLQQWLPAGQAST